MIKSALLAKIHEIFLPLYTLRNANVLRILNELGEHFECTGWRPHFYHPQDKLLPLFQLPFANQMSVAAGHSIQQAGPGPFLKFHWVQTVLTRR